LLRIEIKKLLAVDTEEHLRVSEVIDWQHPEIIGLANHFATGHETSIAIAKAYFE
jgi:hypothetical protein